MSDYKKNAQQSSSSFFPIEDYGIIGNCHTAALINSHGSIDWLCSPRFDSPSIFARILDLEKGGFWSLQTTKPFDSHHQYYDNTNVLVTTFTCVEGRITVSDFMDMINPTNEKYPSVSGRLLRIVEAIEGEVEIISIFSPRLNYAQTLPEFNTLEPNKIQFNGFIITSPQPWLCDKENHNLICSLTLKPGEKVAFTLISEKEEKMPLATPIDALDYTILFWQNWAAKCSYEGPYKKEVIRSVLALKLMTYAPSGAIVAAPTTSLPETIGGERNWDYRFTWIRDASFTLYALLLAGYFENEEPFFNWIVKSVKVEKTGIKILYPITDECQITEQILAHLQGYRNSRPVRIGNQAVGQIQMDVYGEVISALHFAWKAEKYDPSKVWCDIHAMLDWVAQNWQGPDSGIWEVRGGLRHFVYGKVMLWLALNCGIEMVETLNLQGDVAFWTKQRDLIRAEVMEKGWSEKLKAFKQSYEDEILDAANLLLPVVGFIDGKDQKMLSTIDAIIANLVTDGLCYRYQSAPEGVTGKEGAFILCTFWLINALILAGRKKEAQQWFEELLKRSSPLGLFAEEIDPITGAHLGNFPQAFSHIGVINVAVSLAHAQHIGEVAPHNEAAANAVGRGGGGCKFSQS